MELRQQVLRNLVLLVQQALMEVVRG